MARKAEWERLLTRGKDQVQRERAALDEHLRVESQIRRVDLQEIKKWQLVSRQTGVKIPLVVPCHMIGAQLPVTPRKPEQFDPTVHYGLQAPDVTEVTGQPVANEAGPYKAKSGAYLISSELQQEAPLPENLQAKIKVMTGVFGLETGTLHPSSAISGKMSALVDQLLIMFQYEHMINERKDDLDMLVEKELQLREAIYAQSQDFRRQQKDLKDQDVLKKARDSLPADLAAHFEVKQDPQPMDLQQQQLLMQHAMMNQNLQLQQQQAMRQMGAGRQMYPPGFGQIPPQMQPGMDMGPGPVPGGPQVPMQAPPPREKDPGEGGRADRKEPGYPNSGVPDYLQGLPTKHQLRGELSQLDPKLAELQRLL